jgi:hypothetical protein
VLVPTEWLVDIEEDDSGWLDVSLGIEVEGRRLDLAPLLHAVFKQDKRWLDKKKIDAIADDARSRWKPTPASASPCPPAAQALARTLVDLFDSPAASLKLSRFDAPRLADALGDGWQGNGIDGLAAWLERIKGAAHLKPVAAPPASPSPCAPTSSEGLAWLQHLREHGLGGILADDMGLGKTAQTLAHLLTEKHAGRLAKPALVVLPTSLVFNWQREAERFAPRSGAQPARQEPGRGLRQDPRARCLPHHLPAAVARPRAAAAHAYHSLILDEAQTVKNAASQAAQVVRTLRPSIACASGTPLENHLGELWSQFDFPAARLPRRQQGFHQPLAQPCRKRDIVRRDILARRIAPSSCAGARKTLEPPPKTIVVRSVELEGRQRDSTKPCAPP